MPGARPTSVRQSPKDCALLSRADDLLHGQGDIEGALAIYREVLKRFPDDPELLFHVGSAELTAGDVESAKRRLARSVRTRPTPNACRALAKVHELEGSPDAALAEIDRGLALAPSDPALRAARADALFVRGDVEGAHDLLKPLVEREDAHPVVILAFARLAHRVDRVADAARLLESRLDDADPQHQAVMAFRLAGLLERLGEHDRAFAAAERANRLRAFRFDAVAFEARVDEAIRRWTPEAMDALPRPTGDTGRPILIVGMPRSGTSLVERILASHDRVRAGGELGALTRIAVDLGAAPVAPPILASPEPLTRPVVARASRRYLNDLRRLDRQAAHITDKMPTNFLNLGLGAVLVPEATIIHCVRDPRDTCLSCFFQSFGEGLAFAGDLAHLAVVQNAERRMMGLWTDRLGIEVHRVVYEDLVADLGAAARRLVDATGLDWQDGCETFWRTPEVTATASIDQVRQPIYTSSVGRWRHYERHLAPLLDALDRSPDRS